MKWNCSQTERAALVGWYRGVTVSTLHVFSLGLGLLGGLIIIFNLAWPVGSIFLAFGLLGVTVGLLAGASHLYFGYLEEHPEFLQTKQSIQVNVLNGCDFSVLQALKVWRRQQTLAGLLKGILETTEGGLVFYRLGLRGEILGDQRLALPFDEPAMENLLRELLARSSASVSMVAIYPLIAALVDRPEVKALLASFKLQTDQVRGLIEFYAEASERAKRVEEFRLAHPRKTGGFARSWSIAYTNFLDRFTQEITPELAAQISLDSIYARERLLDQLVMEMQKSAGRNILLIGEPGIGKKEIFYHLAERIVSFQTKTELDGLQVRLLDTQHLLAAADSLQQLEQVLEHLINDLVRAGNVILFIDGIDLLLDPDPALGSADLGNLLSSYLSSPKIHLISTTTPEKYIKIVKPSRILNAQFTPIDVPPPSAEDLIKILVSRLPLLERRYRVFFLLAAINVLIQLSGRYLKEEISPKRELDLAEEVAAWAHAHSRSPVTEEAVVKVVENRAKVPIQVAEAERTTLLNLEELLHRRIVGQNTAIKQLGEALLRARAGLTAGNRPIGSFLFLGPTGVGKTETAKALAAIYFGSESRLIRLDMTEFADQNSLEKLLGNDPVRQPGFLTVAIQNTPSAVVLLDEIEKASPEVKNVMLQLLDEGRITTNFGRVLDFTNTIVIATSNAGSDFIKAQIESNRSNANFSKALTDRLITERIFLPEFLNRFDGVIVYLPLTANQIREVVKLQLEKLKQLINQEKGLVLEVGPAVIDQLAERGYDPVFGARALQRVIRSELETAIAREIISQQPTPGAKLTVNTL